MTILTAMQSAMVRLVGHKPPTLFSSTDQTSLEIADLANEVAVDIMKSHEWQALTKIETIVGDGVQSSFPLPPDYDRMVQAQDIHDADAWFWNYTPVGDINEWMTLTESNWGALDSGWWIILGDEFRFWPPPSGRAAYPYVSKFLARSAPASGTGTITPKAQFDADTDTFVLDERLLTLGVIWRFREQKGMGYAEDMANYELALSQEQTRDRGSRVIRSSAGRIRGDFRIAWPGVLG